ncbi:MAG: tetratricopeptide repeat protein, partial [Gemmatimonadetes bacterium]|nr:tetratricopeptide repeat protein [Gemmatimonadota bacterium]
MFEPFPRFRRLLRELGRRHVARVAVIYAAVAFACLEAADIIIPALGLPEWAIRWVVVFALLGFPITLILAWIYDLSPQGITRTEPTVDGRSEPRTDTARLVIVALLMVASAALLVGTGIWSFRWSFTETPVVEMDRKSIAVLPLVNLDPEDEAGIFANGIHDDLLSHLSKIQDLRVISRTSVLQYRDTELSAREIGQQLGAGTILEGSVRRDRENERVRVVAQLIDARTDDHIWSETYDRPSSDIFQVQTEIAQQIARALEAELSEEEIQQIEVASTVDVEAAGLYWEGQSYWDRRESRMDAQRAVRLFEEAVTLDPSFAVAHAALSRARMWLFWKWPGFQEEAVLASEALARATELAPDAAETHLAQGFFHFYGGGDYAEALGHFEEVLRLKPSDTEAISAIAFIHRRQGRWDEAVEGLQRALELDRRSYALNLALGETYLRLRRFEEADRMFQRAVNIAPEVMGTYTERFRTRLLSTGDTVAAREMIEDMPMPRLLTAGEPRAAGDTVAAEETIRDMPMPRPPGAGDTVAAREMIGDVPMRGVPRGHSRLEAALAIYRRDFQAAVEGFESSRMRSHENLALAYHLLGNEEMTAVYADSLRMAMEAVLGAAGRTIGPVQSNVVAQAHAKLGIAHALLGNWAA